MACLRWMIVGVVAAVAAGCGEPTPGTSRNLGAVPYELAFVSAQDVVSQRYSVIEADPATGVITTRPRPVGTESGVLGGSADAREVATLRMRREDENVVAHLSVAMERKRSTVSRRMMQDQENYSGVPNTTPADVDAASTPEQRDLWQPERYLHHIERRLLQDLFARLHPSADPAGE